ncbi:oligopeptide ABC transporter substrate-binding protein [Ornithinibacillus bavariensis]|uniref:ABC transporter substrate-binding protein n=1 Tax=Ornithinibacillus bavariensis TaxID=545502 RepID=A0A919X833_9BACI|nr:oligopeptide ABC transporter substrate-binding protein [Ornithinibacillus bavariensis]GIO26759.1 ABC transporter substrate-binding protein [Ornithinibacillus bavariensis]
MRKTNLMKLLFALMLSVLLVLAACSKDSSSDPKGNDTKTEGNAGKDKEKDKGEILFSQDDFEMTTSNSGEPIGGTLNFGLVSDSVFEGTLNWNFYDGDPDSQVIKWFDESLLDMDANFTYTQDGAATFKTEPYETEEYPNGVTIEFTIRDNVNWHDGEPVKAEDWAYSFEVIGHPEYTGVRYGPDFSDIVGMDEYHAGKADTISGIEIVDEKTLKVTYKQSNPSLLTGGIWPYAMPKHIFKDIPVAKMAESDAVRKNPIGMGPYKVESIVAGESVVYSKNADYWRGEPALDKVVLKVVNPKTVVQELETGGVDMINAFPGDQFVDNADMSNVEFLANIDLYYAYIGFKLGTWDAEKKRVKMDPNAKMADVNLRKAMAHAVDTDSIGKKFYNGLRWKATTLIPPSHPEYHDADNPGLVYDPELAKKILDDAGYKDVDGDGFREDPNGEQLVINYAGQSGSDVAEPMAKYFIQAWENVGLKVQLLDGRLHEFNTFYDRVGQSGEDDPAVDVYGGGWGVGSDVNPYGLYGPDQMFNFPRYESEKNSELLAKGVSMEAFDVEYRKQVYKEWQQLMTEEVPVFPTLYALELVPVNKRVVNYTLDRNVNSLYEVGVTQEEPFKAEKKKK